MAASATCTGVVFAFTGAGFFDFEVVVFLATGFFVCASVFAKKTAKTGNNNNELSNFFMTACLSYFFYFKL
jgi:hypothetical protein